VRRIESLLALVFLASCGDGTGGWLGGAWVKVKSPNGGETWAVGSEQDIVWTWSGRFEGVSIELSRDGGGTWEALADPPNTGSWTWTATGPASSRALVRVSAVGGGAPEDTSDAVFQVVVTSVRHVDADGPGPAYDGKSWATAFLHPQDAVDAAVAGDEVRVAEGTYPLRDSGDVAVLAMKERVNIYGGYAGFGQSDPEERSAAAHVTTLDGEDQAYHVVIGASFATIDGFTVTRGDARGSTPDTNGGGMFNEDLGGLVVANCTFSSNVAADGGGMYNYSSSPTVANCTFSSNAADDGGGICNHSSSPTVTNCTFSLNSAVDGGGMLNLWSYPTVTDCLFSKNSAEYGGGMFNSSSSPALMRCVFVGNSADLSGGGMYYDSS